MSRVEDVRTFNAPRRPKFISAAVDRVSWPPDSFAPNRWCRLVVIWSVLVSLISALQVAGGGPVQAAVVAGGPSLPDQLDLANVPSRPSVFASVSGVGYLLTDPAVGENSVRSYDPARTRLPSGTVKATVGDWDGDGRDEMLLLEASGRLQLLDDASTGFTLLAETTGVTAATFVPTSRASQSEIVVARNALITRYPERNGLAGSSSQLFEPARMRGSMTLVDTVRGVLKVTDLRRVTNSRGPEVKTQVVATYITEDRRGARTNVIGIPAMGFEPHGGPMAEVDGSAIADAVGLADGDPSAGYDISIMAVGDTPGQTLSKRAIWRQQSAGGFGHATTWREVSGQNLGCQGDGRASLASALIHGSEPRVIVACPMGPRGDQGLNVRMSFSVTDMRETSVAFPSTSIERPAVALVVQTYSPIEKAAGFEDELDLVGVAVTVEKGSRQVRGGALSWAIRSSEQPIDLGKLRSRKDGFSFGQAVSTSELPFAFSPQNHGRITIRAERVEASDCSRTSPTARRACETLALPPRPIALLQAPPLVAGLGQEFVPPTFVTGTSSGETSERSVSYTVKSSVGLTIQVPAVVEASMTATVEAQIGESRAQSKSVSISNLYFGSFSDHTVIFIEDDLWLAKYQVTHASDGIGIGQIQHLLLPRQSVVRQMDQKSFRSAYPAVTDGTPARKQSWDTAFGLTPGHPGMYPAITASPTADLATVKCDNPGRPALRGGPVLGGLQQVEMGATTKASSTSVRIGTGREHTQSFELSLGIDGMLKAGLVSQTLGFSRAAGESFTVSAGSDVGVDAYVGHISQSMSQLGVNETYRWRLYFCKRTVGGWPVWVAGYHTSDYAGRGEYLDPKVTPESPTPNANVTSVPALTWTASGTVGQFDVELKGPDSSRVFRQSIEPSAVRTYSESSPGAFQQNIPDKLKSGATYQWRVTGYALTGKAHVSDWRSFKVCVPGDAPDLGCIVANLVSLLQRPS